jgi:hypothetical protein
MSTKTEHAYPYETIDLPSKGIFYPENSPLRSGQIDIQLMTAKHEDILTSTNLIQKGIVLDRLMDALILTKGVKSADLLIGDLNAVMVAARILGYGKDYPVSVPCPRCNEKIEEVVDLTTLSMENEPVDNKVPDFTITLPISKTSVTLKLLTRADELAIEKETRALKKANIDVESDTTSRLRAMIASVDGDTNPTTIWKFVDSLLVRDARYIREQYRTRVPDVDFNITLVCNCTTDPVKVRLPLGANFFWPDATV